jgi:hypothetical protein
MYCGCGPAWIYDFTSHSWIPGLFHRSAEPTAVRKVSADPPDLILQVEGRCLLDVHQGEV